MYRPFPAWAASSGYRLVQRLPCCATVRPPSVRPLDGFAGAALIERLLRMAGICPALLTSRDIKTVRLRRMSALSGRSAAKPWSFERPLWAELTSVNPEPQNQICVSSCSCKAASTAIIFLKPLRPKAPHRRVSRSCGKCSDAQRVCLWHPRYVPQGPPVRVSQLRQ